MPPAMKVHRRSTARRGTMEEMADDTMMVLNGVI